VTASRRAHVAAAWLATLMLTGCDAGRDLLAKGAEAEAAGNFADARARYKEVCDKGSSLCPIAARQIERLSVKEVWKAASEGDYAKAKAALAAARAANDPAVKAAAEAAAHDPEIEHGLAWEEASALPDKGAALPAIEALTDLGEPVSAKARTWLEKNRPGVLLARVEAACQPGGAGSCAEAGKALATQHPASPENAEAQALVQAEYRRVFPLLRQAEHLLIQAVELHDKDELVETCMKHGGGSTEACTSQVVGDRRLPTWEFLAGAWKKKLDEIHDPFFVKPLQARYGSAGKAGEYDPEAWPTPPGTK
jgi:hypothetical protein